MDEKVICSAIWYMDLPTAVHGPTNVDHGTVICGYRHPHCIHAMYALTGKRSVESEVGKFVQGFLTNKNKFVDREEGADIALKNGQIKHLSYSKTKLYSEDLY